MKFKAGDLVEKFKGDYGGLGEVLVAEMLEGRERYLVAHEIAGGFGRFFHVYGPSVLRANPDT